MSNTWSLSFERHVNASPHELFEGWTDAKKLVHWFTPAPWRTAYATMDLRPGGSFKTRMEGPNGEAFDGESCVLYFVKDRLLVWSNLMGQDFIPKALDPAEFGFTAKIEFEPLPQGTLYRATVYHTDEAGMKAHEEMGFEAGWSAALDQLVSLIADGAPNDA